MVFSKNNKGGGRKDGKGNRITKSKKNKEKQRKRLGFSKGSKQTLNNHNLNKNKSRKHKFSNKYEKKSKKNKKGGRYVYFPDKNIIQFLPYSYPEVAYNPSKIHSKLYTGNQAGGNILPQACSNFSPNMLERQFNCKQPFWNENCI